MINNEMQAHEISQCLIAKIPSKDASIQRGASLPHMAVGITPKRRIITVMWNQLTDLGEEVPCQCGGLRHSHKSEDCIPRRGNTAEKDSGRTREKVGEETKRYWGISMLMDKNI
jgi:hypothetical protein